jgi:hypothetical protein
MSGFWSTSTVVDITVTLHFPGKLEVMMKLVSIGKVASFFSALNSRNQHNVATAIMVTTAAKIFFMEYPFGLVILITRPKGFLMLA